jgi:CRP/FNR family transcriptional regulator, polysaccharide utilization system transcription regulator
LKLQNTLDNSPMVKTFKQGDCIQCRKRIDEFKVLRDEDFKLIEDNRFEILYHAGETIFKQGTSFTHIICILEGLVKVYLESRDKKNFIFSVLGPGDLVINPGMFTLDMQQFTVVAVEDTVACHIEKQVMEEIIRNNNLFAIEMLKRANVRNKAYFRKFLTLTRKQMPGRVAEVILYLYKNVYKTNPYLLTLTRQELADMAAITKESTIRVLKDFKDAGLISLNGNDLKILNEKALMNISANG